MRILIPATLALLAAAAAPAQAPSDAPQLSPKAAEKLAGRTPGKPIDCVTLRDIRSTEIVDETAIIYQLDRKRWLVNSPPGGCPGLTRDRAIVTRTPTTRLCRGDIARIIDPVARIEFGSCGLGNFVPYTR